MVLLLSVEDEPLCSKGLMLVHVICMKLSDRGGGSEHVYCILNTNALGEYQLNVEHLDDHPRLLLPGDQLTLLNNSMIVSTSSVGPFK